MGTLQGKVFLFQIQMDNGCRMRWNREVERAIVSSVFETEIRQIKKEYITDRIKESVDVFGNQPERFGIIINLPANLPKRKHRLSQRYRKNLPHQPKQPSIQSYLRFTKN